jgi:hypothetical protein
MSIPSSRVEALHSGRVGRFSFWEAGSTVFLAVLLTLATLPGSASAAPSAQEVMSPSGLRDTLNFLGQEHVYLTTAALGDLLRGDTVAYDASLTRLRDNSGRLSETIGAVYGSEAESQFRLLWQAHYDGFLDYALGASAKDEAVKVEAKIALDTNRAQLGEFFGRYNPTLQSREVAATLRDTIDNMTGAIDAMADKEWGKAFARTHLAAHQSADFMDPLAHGIADQLADKMNGGVVGPAAELSAAFTRLVQEHVFLSSLATGALAIGDSSKAQAAMATAENNTRELSTLVGEIYNKDVGNSFDALWNKHLNAYADYTRAQLAGDKDSAESARQILASWVTDTGGLLAKANPFFTPSSVDAVLNEHVNMTLAGINAQVARDWHAAYTGLQLGSHQSLDMANVVAGGITDAFGEQSGAQTLPPAVEQQP